MEKEMKAEKDAEAMKAAETEVAAHMDAVIERAKTSDGWDINDVVNKVNVRVSEVLDAHGIDDEAKEKSMEHLDNKLSKMLNLISAAKEMKEVQDHEALKAAETEAAAQMERVIEHAESTDGWDINDVVNNVNGHVSKILDAHGIDDAAKLESMDHLDTKLVDTLEDISVEKEMKAAKDAEAMKAAETEVAAHMEQVIERAKTTDGWDIDDVINEANEHVSMVLDAHGIDDAAKGKSMEHLDNKLSIMLDEISVEKEMKAARDTEAMKAAEPEVAAIMEEVIEDAKTSDGWYISSVINKVNGRFGKVLDAHGIYGLVKEKYIESLDNKLAKMLEEISVEKEMEPANDAKAMMAAETEVAAHMDAVIERAKATDGWDINDVVSKVDVGVNKILDAHGIDGALKEEAMDHFDTKLSNMLEEISAEKISAEKDWDINF